MIVHSMLSSVAHPSNLFERSLVKRAFRRLEEQLPDQRTQNLLRGEGILLLVTDTSGGSPRSDRVSP
jgi:hypothetical protein